MISNLENAMAKQTEQATVQATGMESINKREFEIRINIFC